MSRGAQASTKGAKAKADRLFSQIVRSKGFCERCGSSRSLQCAHILSRRYSWTRVDLANAFCLCAGCHMWFTDNPVEFATFVHERRDGAVYDRLIQLAHLSHGKVDWHAEVVRLTRVLAEVNA